MFYRPGSKHIRNTIIDLDPEKKNAGIKRVTITKLPNKYNILPGYIEEVLVLNPEQGGSRRVICGWVDGSGKYRLKGKRGQLVFVRYDHDSDTFVNYQGRDLKSTLRIGDADVLWDLPKSLKERKDIMGTALLKNIDYDQKINEIYEKSEILDFILAVSSLTMPVIR